MSTRAGRAKRVAALRAKGLTHREVAECLGLSPSYAAELASDPDGVKVRARKDSYRGTCQGCGGPTCGGDGRSKAPRFCATCAPDAYSYWTRERIIEALQVWAQVHGRPPRSHPDWTNGRDGHPPSAHVQRRFGSWNAAIAAAGLPVVERGRYERTPEIRAKSSEARKQAWARKRREQLA